jgi:fatty-acid desaturase
MNNKDFITEDDYTTFAGAEWPTYENFVLGNYKVSDQINDEINQYVLQTKKKLANNRFRFSMSADMKFMFQYAVPALAGLIGFFLLGGTIAKFCIVFIACVYINQFYSHSVHKWLTHRQFEPKWWVRPFMLWSFTLHGTDDIANWVIGHKLHHKFADTDQDPILASDGIYCGLIDRHTTVVRDIKNFSFDKQVHLPWKDVLFVSKYQHVFYCFNFLILSIIDLQLALLSLFTLRFASKFYTALSSFVFHGCGKDQPVELKWYWELWLLGDGLHKSHHDNPGVFDLSRKGRIDPGAKIWKFFVKNIRK